MTCPCNTSRLAGLARNFTRSSLNPVGEVREEDEGEFYHLVTLWKATREERELYEDSA